MIMIKNNIVIEGARIGFRNFSGKEGKFNPPGRRNFCVFLEELVAVDPNFNDGVGVRRAPDLGPGFYIPIGYVLEKDGWNVRWLQPREELDVPVPYLQVAVNYENIPPKIIIISSKGKTLLDAESVGLLDWAEITEIDLIIRPYNWVLHEGTKGEKRGVKAYVKSMYVTIAEDEFEKKYYDVPDSAANSIGGCGNCDTCDGSCDCGHTSV
jgi:hypothetical protein